MTTYRNATLIYNPAARGLSEGKAGRLENVLRILRDAGHQVRAAATQGPGTAADLARRSVAEGTDLVLVAGGDGTLNEALCGVVNSEAPLGVLPAGTANVLACELGLGNLARAAASVGRWAPKRVAAGLLNSDGGKTSRYFLLMAGAGVDARIINHVNPGLKRQSGKLSYWLAGFRELGRRFEEFEVRLDGERFPCSFALASRVRNYGGAIKIARHASLLRDEFEVVLFEGSNSLRYLKYLAGVLAGQLEGMSGVRIVKARQLELSPPPGATVYVQVDGEAAGCLPARIEIVPAAVTLLVPPEFAGP